MMMSEERAKINEDVNAINEWCKNFVKENQCNIGEPIDFYPEYELIGKDGSQHPVSICKNGIGVFGGNTWLYADEEEAKGIYRGSLLSNVTECKKLVLQWKQVKQSICDTWNKIMKERKAIMEFEV